MVSKKVVVTNEEGLHLRPADNFIYKQAWDSRLYVMPLMWICC